MHSLLLSAVAVVVTCFSTGATHGVDAGIGKKNQGHFVNVDLKPMFEAGKLKEGMNLVRHEKGGYRLFVKLNQGKIAEVLLVDAKGKKAKPMNLQRKKHTIRVCFSLGRFKKCFKISF